MITIRKSVDQTSRELIPTYLEKALSWMKKRYPDVSFDNLDYIFSGAACRSRYFRNEMPNSKYTKPTIHMETKRDTALLYWKPSLGMVRNEVENVGREDVTVSGLIHELTHHVQYERNERKGNELDTTRNELLFYQEFRPDVYELFMK